MTLRKDKSYDAVLEEFEIDYCSSALKTMFNGYDNTTYE